MRPPTRACWRASTARHAAASWSSTTCVGTVNMLEYCRAHRRRLHPAQHQPRLFDRAALHALPCRGARRRVRPHRGQPLPPGLLAARRRRGFSTEPPVLSTAAPSWLPSTGPRVRRGLRFPGLDQPLRRAGRRGPVRHAPTRASSPTGSHAWLRRRPLRYIGFDGTGHQVRDCLASARSGAAAASARSTAAAAADASAS